MVQFQIASGINNVAAATPHPPATILVWHKTHFYPGFHPCPFVSICAHLWLIKSGIAQPALALAFTP